ncbi:Protein TolQ [Psychrobacter sp. SC65A.3]|uniref:MotA/TolQ/ExbB proton channel family protein n=1 Tax=unclassified Psychrobacter TaxID=196806 RepID=UPI000354A3A4|nr:MULTISPECIES: MotA/TolQ/ExbB proton channel family protein [unclassified Psychrobacter]AGP49556.1 biopolymer transporter ExbB [Psychrobacter sp. G]WAI87171.1 Protein TolQ [Psychrobacter sp. SC65A.3]
MDFTTYWQYSDMVTRTLFFLLLALSIISWVTGIIRVLQSRKLVTTVADDLSQQMQAKRSDLSVADAATRRLITEQTLLKHIGRYRFASERGLPILGTTAAIAPFIGLFGTVWGIFHALRNIGMSGQAGLGQVAGPVGEALIMTGLGIAVAIPAVVFYNLAVRINRSIMYHANDRAHDLLAQSAELAVTQQSSINNEHAVTQAQLVKGNHTETQAPQQTEHYHKSAPSQP